MAAFEASRRSLARWVEQMATLEEVELIKSLRGSLTHSPERASEIVGNLTEADWHHCAVEGGTCSCEGSDVRFGYAHTWLLQSGPPRREVACQKSSFGGSDPVPHVLKVCECSLRGATCSDGRPADLSRCPRHSRVLCAAACPRWAEIRGGWSDCANEGDMCRCARDGSQIRFGLRDSWLAYRGPPASAVACVKATFGGADPAPHEMKVCQCQDGLGTCLDGQPADLNGCLLTPAAEAARPREAICSGGTPYELLWSCDRAKSRLPAENHPDEEAQTVLDEAVAELCRYDVLARQFETYLDCSFVDNYIRWTRNESEWLEEAYVSYVGGKRNSVFEWAITTLVRSVHLFSQRPIVVVIVDDIYVPPLSWQALPNLLVYKMHPRIRRSLPFNFNKVRAMVGSRVLTGIELDSDQLITGRLDRVFAPTRRECTVKYPFPILPVHYMTRDAEACVHTDCKYNFLEFEGPRSMRWCHAHPSWTFWALPFWADMLFMRMAVVLDPGERAQLGFGEEVHLWKLDARRPLDMRSLLQRGRAGRERRPVKHEPWMISDEPMTNAWLWLVGASKAWCKFDVDMSVWAVGPDLKEDLYHDRKWYVDGLPVLFYSMHGTKDFAVLDSLLTAMVHCSRPEVAARMRCPGRVWGRREDGTMGWVSGAAPQACRPGSREEWLAKAADERQEEYMALACCCLAPRLTQPIFWQGVWYNSSSEVPSASARSGAPRLCLMA